MDFLSKQIGVNIMEKFKIYIHHHYTYELFWYFCHGVEIEPEKVPTFFIENRFNKNIKINESIKLNGIYKNNQIEIIFCNDKLWEKSDGYHLLDYSITLLENGLTSDRGGDANNMKESDTKNVSFLNKHSINLGNRIGYMYIDWEGHDAYKTHNWKKRLNPKIQTFVDETSTSVESNNNHNFVFTNTIWSFLQPNTLGIRDYYFFHDYLKYKNDYKYKINVPIRRLYGDKEKIANSVLSLNNPNITVTHSSFGSSSQYDKNISSARKELISKIPTENYINKRGYGINDWGGEWNSNNMNENMWKMFGISEVCIIYEYCPSGVYKSNFKSWKPGKEYMTEKSISHILVGKPFIPYHRETIDFYDSYLKKYGKSVVKFPIEYNNIINKMDWLDKITKDDSLWQPFLESLTEYVLNLRKGIIEIIHENNSYLDYVISDTQIQEPNSSLL